MRAAVWARYGPPEVLEVRELDDPVPGDNDILVRVRASTVTAGDAELRRLRSMGALVLPLRLFLGVMKPRGIRVTGQELAGEVVAVGDQVSKFAVGDRVFGHAGFRFGANAELASLPERGLVARIPDGVSFVDAATLPTAGVYGLYFTRQADIRPGQSVLVNGGAGSIGTYAIQLALGAGARVDAVDRGDKSDFLRDLGVAEIVDYRKQAFTDVGRSYDFILDVIDKSSFPKAAKALNPGGTYLHSNPSPVSALRRGLFKAPDGRRSVFVAGRDSASNLDFLAGEVSAGRLRSIVDREFGLEAIVEAHRYAESGDKRGHIIVVP